MARASVLWFRRDLRLCDHPALVAAVADSDEVLGLFVLDDALWGVSGANRRAFLSGALHDLSNRMAGRLAIVGGDPATVVPRVARLVEASAVHVSADFGPYGAVRDARVEKALGRDGIELVRTGSAYAVAPGRVRKDDGLPYKVFTPFARRWVAHGWQAPAPSIDVQWVAFDRGAQSIPTVRATASLPTATEAAARARWQDFASTRLSTYARDRDDLAAYGTSGMSAYLRWGLIHPRTLLAGLPPGDGGAAFRTELCWREFYADVLWHAPQSARSSWNPAFDAMDWDSGPEADQRFLAWAEGRTGYPIIDAGMRQLLAEGWMHNRARMLAASFLVKDLHIDWRRGARHFMRHLVDGDLASNQHGWQWTAGSGTDAAPYHRVFNPTAQALRFDPEGDFVRRYVPELRAIRGPAVHEPWTLPDGVPDGYPTRIVDHATERREALHRHRVISER